MTTSTAPIRTKTEPWPHQRDAYAFALPKHGALLEMGMGTGKTRVAIELILGRGHMRTLVVCPKSVMTDAVWTRELAKHTDQPFVVCELDRGTIRERATQAKAALDRATLQGVPVLLVCNYEAAWRAPLADVLTKAQFDFVIADESHRVKAPGGKASLYLSRLGVQVPWRLALTGTPLAHGLLDAYAQYRFLDRRVFGSNFAAFRAHYAITNPHIPQMVVGYRNQDEFSDRFYSIAYHVGSDVLHLPEPTHITRRFQIEPPARRIYEGLRKDFIAELDGEEITAANVLTRLLRFQQITSGYVRTDAGEVAEIDNSKRSLLEDVFEDLDQHEPIVVFARFLSDLGVIEQTCLASGRRYAELSGSRKDLTTWKDGDADVLGVQIQSGGVGIDLTRARYCVYYSLDFSLANYLQSLARVHRPGQTRPVTYVHLLASDTVDEQIYAALESKQDVVETIRKWAALYGR